MDFELTRKVLAALEREQAEYIVFGAVALALHGMPRATEDLDIFIAPTSVFDDPTIEEITADDRLGEYPAVQYVPPSGPFHIDILTRLGELYTYASLECERVDYEGLAVNVVTPDQLFHQMKRSTVRTKDKADAERIVEEFGFEED
ncbi:MAG TPA: hypothetical protein VIV11_25300 [Kofleriaceae bacterium]